MFLGIEFTNLHIANINRNHMKEQYNRKICKVIFQLWLLWNIVNGKNRNDFENK